MSNSILKTRIQNKHDTEENWNKATNFIPLKGEVIVYDIVSSANGASSKIKIGDGVTKVSELPFLNSETFLNLTNRIATLETAMNNILNNSEYDVVFVKKA